MNHFVPVLRICVATMINVRIVTLPLVRRIVLVAAVVTVDAIVDTVVVVSFICSVAAVVVAVAAVVVFAATVPHGGWRGKKNDGDPNGYRSMSVLIT